MKHQFQCSIYEENIEACHTGVRVTCKARKGEKNSHLILSNENVNACQNWMSQNRVGMSLSYLL